MFSSKNCADVHCAKALASASWKEHTSMTIGSKTGTRSSASRSCWTWSRGALVGLSISMLVKMYLLDGTLLGGVSLGEPAGVAMGVVNSYVAGASFVLGVVVVAVGFVPGVPVVVVVGRLVTGLWSVTDEYGCKLRKGLFVVGLLPGVIDTSRACFFLFLLLCVIHRIASAIDCWYLVSWGFWRACRTWGLIIRRLLYQLSVGVDRQYIRYLLACCRKRTLSDFLDACSRHLLVVRAVRWFYFFAHRRHNCSH